jgi:excinuclease ABC subunit C
MNRCCGVCTGNISPEEYRESVRYAADILTGKSREVKKQIEAQMYAYAEEERYEAAANCRDTLAALNALESKQKVVASPTADQDVVAFYSDELCSCVSVFYIREGVLQDKAEFLYGADSILEREDMTTFLCEHYKKRKYVPSEILLSFDMEADDLALVSEYLSKASGHRVYLKIPERGQRRELCDMVEKNAAEKAKQYQINAQKEEGTLLRLMQMLALESYPARIEAYDISNLGSEHLTAGMVVYKDGRFSKADYRSFHIRSVKNGTDDYASMREALARRLEHLNDKEGSFSEYPDLILLDGGKGHVSTVLELLREKEIVIPVFGMVKDDYHKTRALCTDSEEISIAREQDIFGLVYRIQEEVHRFTVGRMENAKRKTVKTSVLTKISGIGDAKAKKLLKSFGGVAKVKTAALEELAAVSGISQKDALAVFEYYHKANDPK